MKYGNGVSFCVAAVIIHLGWICINPKIKIIVNSILPFSTSKSWVHHVHRHHKKIYSQKGQDGVIEYIFNNIGTTNQYFIEFGFNAQTMFGGTGPNTANLYKNGWKGLLLDGDNENSAINLHKEFIGPDNIVSLFGNVYSYRCLVWSRHHV